MIIAKGKDRAVVNAVERVERAMEVRLACIRPGLGSAAVTSRARSASALDKWARADANCPCSIS